MQFDDNFPAARLSDDVVEIAPLAGDALDGWLTGSLEERRAERVRRFFEASPARWRLLEQLRVWVRRDEAGWALLERERMWAVVRRAVEGRGEAEAEGEATRGYGAFRALVGRRGVGRRILPTNVTSPAMNRPSLSSGVPAREKSARPVLNGVGVLGTQPLRRPTWYALVGVGLGAAVLVAGWKLGDVGVIRRIGTPEATYTAYITANGERANITLPDGNTVVLNVASRLEVPTNYSAGNHVVRLPVGEALFTVSHHARTPFTVDAGVTVARVLGTTFVVRHYLTDTVGTVAVEEGKVAVNTTVVTAQHFVEIDPHGVVHIHAADPSRFAFATGVLTLGVTPLLRAVPELDRWYNADVRLGDPALANQEIMGKFVAGSLTDLAAILKWTFDVRVVRDGRVLTLFPKSR